jgi:hypothetical protein
VNNSFKINYYHHATSPHCYYAELMMPAAGDTASHDRAAKTVWQLLLHIITTVLSFSTTRTTVADS